MSSGIIMRNGIQYGNAVLNKADEILTDDNKTVQDELNTLKTSLNDLQSKVKSETRSITTNSNGVCQLTGFDTDHHCILAIESHKSNNGYICLPTIVIGNTYFVKVLDSVAMTKVSGETLPITIRYITL